jgi:D-galactarolactone cycloisomerase
MFGNTFINVTRKWGLDLIIERIETYPLVYILRTPYGDANGYKKYRSCMMIRVTTSSGIQGWGECVDWLPGLMKGFEERLVPFLIGKKVTDHTQIVADVGKWHQRSAAAISMAFTEIIAKHAGLSICDLWGGRIRDKVPVYASFQSYSDQKDWIRHSLEIVGSAVQAGHQRIKVKVGGRALNEDQKHISQLQNLLGEQVLVALDANQSYDAATAFRWERLFKSWDNLLWFEEPLPMDFVPEYKQLRSSLSIPLAGGENLLKPFLFLQILSQGALDIIQPDVMHMEGLEAFRDTAKCSRYYGARFSPHCYDGVLSRLYALFVQATLPSWSKMEEQNIEPVEWDVMENPLSGLISLTFNNGEVTIPDGRGLGVEVDVERMLAYLWDGSRYW